MPEDVAYEVVERVLEGTIVPLEIVDGLKPEPRDMIQECLQGLRADELDQRIFGHKHLDAARFIVQFHEHTEACKCSGGIAEFARKGSPYFGVDWCLDGALISTICRRWVELTPRLGQKGAKPVTVVFEELWSSDQELTEASDLVLRQRSCSFHGGVGCSLKQVSTSLEM